MNTIEQTERLEKLSPAKRALLMKSLQKNATLGQETQTIPRRERQSGIPLSFAQQRLWLIDRLESGTVAYNVPFAVRLTGPLDVAAFERSINEVVKRHEALRTTFMLEGDQPIQIIAPHASLTVSLVNLKDSPADEKEAQVQRLAAAEARIRFDLSKGPLLRTTLLQLDQDEHVALFTMHHIVSDGWSDSVLIEEMIRFYEADLTGRPAALAELPIQYADFALWQRERLQGAVLDELLSYWKQQLAGAPPLLNLPTDYPRPPLQTHPGALQSKIFSERVCEGLRRLSRQEGVTPFVTVLAAFKTLLYKYTNQTDVVIGTPVAHRTRLETEGLIGCFLNTLALRTDLSGNPTFRQLLRQVQAVTLGAQEHQDLPFELLIETLSPERNISYAPLFQVLFLYQNKPLENLNQRDLSLTPIDIHSGTAKFDLALSVVEGTNGQLTASLEYNTDLFNAQTITRLLGHFETLLAAIVSDPDEHLHDLNLLAEAEQEQILFRWNATETEFSETACLHKLFEEQAARTPEAVALVFGSDSLTYRELNKRANQLAHKLQSLGVGTESVVALLMERSLEMVVSLFAVLKAGGAYLPLDPSYPSQLLSFMLSDAQPVVLLRQRGQAGALTIPAGMTVVAVDAESMSGSDANPEVEVGAANLAYVIYTSGSTGKPKGTLVTHYNVTRLLEATQSWFNFTDRDVWTLFHSYAFDFSVWEIWGALLYGGKLIVIPYTVSRSPAAFYELLVRKQVTVLNQTPSAFRQLMQAEESSGASSELSLRLIIFGGEALELQSLKPWFERHGDTIPQLVNMYGITETTVHVTYRPLTTEDLTAAPGSMIGVPIPDLQVYILDQHMQPVPFGVPGEMYVGGAGVARGYRGRPELTAERFVPHPYSREAGARLYRTGDVARYLDTGELEYRGRADYQVKIRGYRVELGEIEAVLRQHEAITDAVVVARENVLGEKQLVGYVVMADGTDATGGKQIIAALRKYIGARLPHYMIPALLMKLDEMPLSANGKIDRQRLPAIETKEVKTEPAAPTNPTEEKLLAIWTQVLRISQMSIDDNFFALGGDSIRIVQIVSQAQYKGLHFEAQLIYQHQTIRELALEIDKAAQQTDVVPEQAGEEEDVETLARLMEMLEGLSETDVKERIEEKTVSSLERIIP